MRWLLALLAAMVFGSIGLPLVVLMAAADTESGGQPSSAAFDDVPAEMLGLYQAAVEQRCPGLRWSVLAGVGKIESDHGRLGGASMRPTGNVAPRIIGPPLDGSDGVRLIPDTDGGYYDDDPVLDRAVGPMQFLPSTWEAVGIDASGNGVAGPHNAIDAVHSAAIYLCDHGAGDPDRIRQVLFAYNNSWSYVDQVLQFAARYEVVGLTRRDDSDLIDAVLDNPRITIYEGGRRDIVAGEIDARVLQMLQLLAQEYELGVSSLISGRSRCVGGGNYPGCTVSHHWHGRAVDVYLIDGQTVDHTHAAARDVVGSLMSLEGELRPAEVGHPWPDLTEPRGFFTDAAHQRHLHLGWQEN